MSKGEKCSGNVNGILGDVDELDLFKLSRKPYLNIYIIYSQNSTLLEKEKEET